MSPSEWLFKQYDEVRYVAARFVQDAHSKSPNPKRMCVVLDARLRAVDRAWDSEFSSKEGELEVSEDHMTPLRIVEDVLTVWKRFAKGKTLSVEEARDFAAVLKKAARL